VHGYLLDFASIEG